MLFEEQAGAERDLHRDLQRGGPLASDTAGDSVWGAPGDLAEDAAVDLLEMFA